jgi:23S rRNA (pseudouridine1915-N3)-methyltransferase
MAQKIAAWGAEGLSPAFVIGGADGIDPGLKAEARFMLRLSSLTMPHGLVRVLIAEQLYRAWSLLNHHPYHRA